MLILHECSGPCSGSDYSHFVKEPTRTSGQQLNVTALQMLHTQESIYHSRTKQVQRLAKTDKSALNTNRPMVMLMKAVLLTVRSLWTVSNFYFPTGIFVNAIEYLVA